MTIARFIRSPLIALCVIGLLCAPLGARTITDQQVTDSRIRVDGQGSILDDGGSGTGVLRPTGADPAATLSLIMHDIGNARTTISNFGVLGNPNSTPGFRGFEWPLNSGSNFLFAAGIWVGATINGVHRVSTTVDGDNGTGEFWPEHIGTLPADRAPTNNDWYITSKSFATFSGRSYVLGPKAADDDGDWSLATDDVDHNGKASENWDLGAGYLGFDDDGDGRIDEDSVYVDAAGPHIIDVDNDGNVADSGPSSDHNLDGNCNYDPEPHVDEDPAGDISHDRIDNDHDGLVDMDDPDYDGDLAVGMLDDDGDGRDDEDGVARGAQEYYAAFHDNIAASYVRNPDSDGHVPLRVEMLQRSYAFPEAYAGDFILVDYLIRNVGVLPLNNVYIAMFSDPDIGAPGETGDAASVNDGNYYDTLSIREGETVPMMVQGKFNFWNGAYTPGTFAIEVVKTPIPLGDLKVTFANFGRLAGGDPENDATKYNLISSGQQAPRTANADDWRMMLAFGDNIHDGFTLMPDSVLPITVAILSGRTVADVKANARSAYNMYLHDFQGPASPDVPNFGLDIYQDKVRIRWYPNAEASIDAFTGRPSFEGYTVERSTDQVNWQVLASYDVIDRLDTLIVNGEVVVDPARAAFEWQNFNQGMPRDTLWNEGHTEYQYWYLDTGLIPGHTYYYTVRSFSKGVPGAGILYSGRTGNFQRALMARTAATEAPTDLSKIFIYPNPYKGSHPGEEGGQINAQKQLIEYPRKLYFMGLPANSIAGKCMIRFYSLAGDHLATIDHRNGTEYDQWDMNTMNRQEVASGIYYYTVEYTKPGGGTERKIDKFVVIK
jgi:hypothetical protein